MKEVSLLEQAEALNFDTMKASDYEKATGVKYSEVQDGALANLALLAPRAVEDKLTWAVQQIAAIAPRDAIECMLAQQLIALNSMMMKCAQIALSDDLTVAVWDLNAKHAARLSNAFSNVSLALAKHRGRGKQTIVVKHQQVHVASGGQAVIGDVNHRGVYGKDE